MMSLLIDTVAVLASTISVLVYIKIQLQIRLVPELSTLNTPLIKSFPKISFIIPACNEEETIRAALLKVLNIDYPTYQVIVVNDRSTDRTGQILDELQRDYPILEVIHISELPAGWLGKLHALQVGTESASGEYLVYADADVHFHPQFFKNTISYAQQLRLDYLSAIPHFEARSWVLRALIFAFTSLFLATTRVGSVNREREGAFAGIGVFQLIRRSFFEKTLGWRWLKLEIGDDMATALMCHQHGARARFLRATDQLSLTWYPSVSALLAGLEKNSFPVGMRFSVLRTIIASAVILLFAISPLWLISQGEGALGWLFLTLQVTFNVCSPSTGSRWHERICAPYISLLLIIALCRSAWKTLRQGGIFWRGTFYSTQSLKAGQRLKW